MDKKWRSSERNSTLSYKKSNRSRLTDNPCPAAAPEDLAEYVLKVLSRHEESLVCERQQLAPGHTVMRVSCQPEVVGRLIGKGGRTISALRLLIRCLANYQRRRVDIEVQSGQKNLQEGAEASNR